MVFLVEWHCLGLLSQVLLYITKIKVHISITMWNHSKAYADIFRYVDTFILL